MYINPKGLALKVITEKVDSSAVRHPNGEKVAGSFADRLISHSMLESKLWVGPIWPIGKPRFA